MKRKLQSARRRMEKRNPERYLNGSEIEGNPEDYFEYAKNLRKGERVCLMIRVSGRDQERRGSLDRQEYDLFNYAIEQEFLVLGVFREACSGWMEDRLTLKDAASLAEENGAYLLFESHCRALRHFDYHSKKNADILPSVADFGAFRQFTLEVPLCTKLDPSNSNSKNRSLQMCRAMCKDTKRIKALDEMDRKKKQTVVERYIEKGVSDSSTAILARVNRSTVHRIRKRMQQNLLHR